MSKLVYDGSSHTLTLLDAKGKQVGQWHANNIVDHRATMRFVPNGSHRIIDTSSPHRHKGDADTLNGAYGRFGIVRMAPFTSDGHHHDGVGVHAGRADKGGADHATMGCIRTTDEAMAAITAHIGDDALTTIAVQSNHGQAKHVPHPKGHGHAHKHGHTHGHAHGPKHP